MPLITDRRWLLCCALCDLGVCCTVGMGRSDLLDSQVKAEVVCAIPYGIWTAAYKLQVVHNDTRFLVKYSHVTARDRAAKSAGKTADQSEAEEPALLGSIFEKDITNNVDLSRWHTAVVRIAVQKPATAQEVKDALSRERAPNIRLVPDTASYRKV